MAAILIGIGTAVSVQAGITLCLVLSAALDPNGSRRTRPRGRLAGERVNRPLPQGDVGPLRSIPVSDQQAA